MPDNGPNGGDNEQYRRKGDYGPDCGGQLADSALTKRGPPDAKKAGLQERIVEGDESALA